MPANALHAQLLDIQKITFYNFFLLVISPSAFIFIAFPFLSTEFCSVKIVESGLNAKLKYTGIPFEIVQDMACNI